MYAPLVTLLNLASVASAGRGRPGVEFTVSGHSSGGSMASQHALVFSSSVLGLGHFQAAPYACARQPNPIVCTLQPQGLDVEAMIEYTERSFAEGLIENPENLRHRPIWAFGGAVDSIVLPQVVTKAAELYRHFSDVVVEEELPNCQHAFATDLAWSGSNACSVLRQPYINFCDYDMAGAMFKHLYGELNERTDPDAEAFFSIDQTLYFPPGYSQRQIGIGESAFAYVPEACKAEPETCRLHVMYHGCSGSVWSVGSAIMEHAGFNQWAEANDMVILYPQTFQSNCWDWNGAILSPRDERFDTLDGIQLGVMNRMIQDLSSQLRSKVAKGMFGNWSTVVRAAGVNQTRLK